MIYCQPFSNYIYYICAALKNNSRNGTNMEKQKADQIITNYSKKIYGFAMKKAFSYDEAEELGAQMVSEVYLSLLHAEAVANIDGYIWRICENTYARYVASEKKKQGVSIDGVEVPYFDEYDLGESNEELLKLRKEIGFLSSMRRKIVYYFYYEGKSIRQIAIDFELSEGTVKWHLNKARNDLKEVFSMERKIGQLGISPVEAVSFSHNGYVIPGGAPEDFLGDKINLNIVYSVYDEPKTTEGIAEEMGMTPVYLEERIRRLTDNGFLVETKGNKFTTYVKFTPQKLSLEMGENILKMKLKAADILAEKYVPQVLEALKDFDDVYIPGGNRELFYASVIFYAITEKCVVSIEKNLNKYRIRPLAGGDYFATIYLKPEILDPDYQFTINKTVNDYSGCGAMTRKSDKYPGVYSWSSDSRFSNRSGSWQNNLTTDYDALYEVMTGMIEDTKSHSEKYDRLRSRGFITEDGKINIMVINGAADEFFAKIPKPDKALLDEFAGYALEQAMNVAKLYPSSMQDLVIWEFVRFFISHDVAMMVMDILYDEKRFKPLTESEKVTANLLMFSDSLPKELLRVK